MPWDHLAFGCASESLAGCLFLALKIFDSPGLRYMLCTLSLNSPCKNIIHSLFLWSLDHTTHREWGILWFILCCAGQTKTGRISTEHRVPRSSDTVEQLSLRFRMISKLKLTMARSGLRHLLEHLRAWRSTAWVCSSYRYRKCFYGASLRRVESESLPTVNWGAEFPH